MATLEEIRARFSADRFATETVGIEIREAQPGRAVCALGDFTFAVSANAFSDRISVSMQHDITYLAPAKGTTLLAESHCVRCGHSTCFYKVDITDDLGTQVAFMTVNGFVTNHPAKFEKTS